MAYCYATTAEVAECNRTINRDDKDTQGVDESSKRKDKHAGKSKSKSKSKKPQTKSSKDVLAVSNKEPRSSKQYSDRGKEKRPNRNQTSRADALYIKRNGTTSTIAEF